MKLFIYLFSMGLITTLFYVILRYLSVRKEERIEREREREADVIILNTLLGDYDVETYNSDYNDHH